MKPLIFAVSPIGSGTLYIMPKPDGNHLPQAVTHLYRLGIDILVSLLEAHEIGCYGLGEEGKLLF